MWSVDKLEDVEHSEEYRTAYIIKQPSCCRIKVNIVNKKIKIPTALTKGVYELHVDAKDRCKNTDKVYIFSIGGEITAVDNVNVGGQNINYKTCCK